MTGLAMLGYASVDEALSARPGEMVSVSPETWELLARARRGGGLSGEFAAAWDNGCAFAAARDGLRHRRPLVIEWKGSHRAPGDEVAPIDLRVDHVFLVSCKYLSRILINASPAHLFDRLLQGPHGRRERDWYAEVAPGPYAELFDALRDEPGLGPLPGTSAELSGDERRRLAAALAAGWPPGAHEPLRALVAAVSQETARRWRERLPSPAAAEALYWRLLRFGSAPYFVLGSSPRAPLRLRVATPWDWRLNFRLRAFDVAPEPGGQPRVAWRALVEDRHSRAEAEVAGHVEIRWSHGRFSGNPEAKVYLDSPHAAVPGYFPLG